MTLSSPSKRTRRQNRITHLLRKANGIRPTTLQTELADDGITISLDTLLTDIAQINTELVASESVSVVPPRYVECGYTDWPTPLIIPDTCPNDTCDSTTITEPQLTIA